MLGLILLGLSKIRIYRLSHTFYSILFYSGLVVSASWKWHSWVIKSKKSRVNPEPSLNFSWECRGFFSTFSNISQTNIWIWDSRFSSISREIFNFGTFFWMKCVYFRFAPTHSQKMKKRNRNRLEKWKNLPRMGRIWNLEHPEKKIQKFKKKRIHLFSSFFYSSVVVFLNNSRHLLDFLFFSLHFSDF